MAPSLTSTTVYNDPIDDPELYPPFEEFMKALQDEGKMLGKKKQVMSYPLLMKALNNSVKVLQKKYSDYGIPKNPTDAKKAIVYHVIHV